MIDAVVFDMDGVLVDSEPLWQDAEIEVFGALGVPLTHALCMQTMGMRIDAVVRHWHARHPWPDLDVEAVADAVVDGVAARLRPQHALAGAVDVPEALRGRGLPIAIASSSPKRLIDAVVGILGLGVDATCSAEDHPRGKPHPAVYLAAADALGVPPERCLAVEDSVTGVIAARAAAMHTVAIPAPELRDDPRFAIAHATLPSLAALPGYVATR